MSTNWLPPNGSEDTLNAVILTKARWRRLHPELRTTLRQILGGKSAIINRKVLDIAKDLCTRDAYRLALTFYASVDGISAIPASQPITASGWPKKLGSKLHRLSKSLAKFKTIPIVGAICAALAWGAVQFPSWHPLVSEWWRPTFIITAPAAIQSIGQYKLMEYTGLSPACTESGVDVLLFIKVANNDDKPMEISGYFLQMEFPEGWRYLRRIDMSEQRSALLLTHLHHPAITIFPEESLTHEHNRKQSCLGIQLKVGHFLH
jgi:hypothetical protein